MWMIIRRFLDRIGSGDGEKVRRGTFSMADFFCLIAEMRVDNTWYR